MTSISKKNEKILERMKAVENITFTNFNFEMQADEFTPMTFTPMAISPLSALQIKNAYGVNRISKINNNELGNGINVAIVIAGTYNNAQRDLDFYCDFYRLPKKRINLVKMVGARSQGWEIEGALDIQCAYTMALGSNIFLIQATSASFNDMMNAIGWCNRNRMDVINMSFGASEFKAQSSFNNFFNNPNILYCAASGDTSVTPHYPSVASNVLSVGGTTLSTDVNNNRATETTWGQGGCTPSKFELKPSYQNNVDDLPNTLIFRNTPDISANANPSSGVKIYCNGRWSNVGGTSASCPLMCGILAIVCEKRRNLNKSKLNTIATHANNIQKILYDLSKNNTYTTYFFDVISGRNGNLTANANYDIPTGLGVVKADTIVDYLSNI